jgi:hypothetical protein
MVAFFKKIGGKDRYKKEVKKIRDDSKLFFEKHASGVLSNGGLSFIMDYVWKKLVESFIKDWGKDMAPHDIRWSYSSRVPLFDWPHNEDADEDIIEAVTTVINEHFPSINV